MAFVEVTTIDNILLGGMKHVEVEEKEIMIANVDGPFYAMSNRRGRARVIHILKAIA